MIRIRGQLLRNIVGGRARLAASELAHEVLAISSALAPTEQQLKMPKTTPDKLIRITPTPTQEVRNG